MLLWERFGLVLGLWFLGFPIEYLSLVLSRGLALLRLIIYKMSFDFGLLLFEDKFFRQLQVLFFNFFSWNNYRPPYEIRKIVWRGLA